MSLPIPNKDQNPNSPEDSVSKALDKVAKLESELKTLSNTVADKLDGMNEVMSAILNRRVEELEDEPDTTNDDADWETSFKGKKPPPKADSEPTVNQDEKVKKIIKEELSKRDELNKYDAKAYSEFPQLNDPTHPLRKATEAVLKERKLTNKAFDSSPSAIYDATKIAYADLVRKGEIVPETFQAEAQRLLTVGDGMLIPLRGTNAKKNDDLTPSEMLWAKNLGVSIDKYKERKKQLALRKGKKESV